MSQLHSHSWADVVNNSGAALLPQSGKQEFRWKIVKKGRLRRCAAAPANECNGDHCQTSKDPCTEKECIARLDRQLSIVKAENIAVAATFEARLHDLDKLRQEIAEYCKTDDFFSADAESSRLALLKAKRIKSTPVFCECLGCQLLFQQNESAISHQRLSAAQHRVVCFNKRFCKRPLCC